MMPMMRTKASASAATAVISIGWPIKPCLIQFNYDEHDRTNFSPASDAQRFLVPGSTSIALGFAEHLENPERN